MQQSSKDANTYNTLSLEEQRVILHKGTEMPFSGKYTDCFKNGVYVCKQCNAPLYLSQSKFHSGCGWPSFDDCIAGAVKQQPDADGKGIEVVYQTVYKDEVRPDDGKVMSITGNEMRLSAATPVADNDTDGTLIQNSYIDYSRRCSYRWAQLPNGEKVYSVTPFEYGEGFTEKNTRHCVNSVSLSFKEK